MIHWVWCLVAAILGTGFGMFITAIITVSKKSDYSFQIAKGGENDEEELYYAGKPKD